MTRLQRILLGLAALFALHGGVASAEEMGDIDFPNSGSDAAQAPFIEGVKALHSFQFDEAQLAFQQAQEADPEFALAYWGEAMSVNKPLWRIQDTDAARATLERLAPTLEERLEKAPTEKEQAFLQAAQQLFYGSDDKLERDYAYSDALRQMHERWPDDHEMSIFYALSILGTVRPGDQGFRRQARAAALSMEVFAANPGHPGAAHFTIHSFDDPDHAILALPSARVYAGIAPDAAHALHMPSHIFLQLGMWQDVINSNIEAYRAAFSLNERLKLPEGREDFHTLSWLAYGYLMLGNTEEAADKLDRAQAALQRNPGNARIEEGYLSMRARHVLEAGSETSYGLAPADTVEGMHANWIAAVGIAAARRNAPTTAAAAHKRLTDLVAAAAKRNDQYEQRRISVLADQVRAVLQQKRGNVEAALASALQAAETELTLGAPSGPPDPVKPAWELYGELLLTAERYDESVAAFQKSLEWIPQRTPSLLGLARAASHAGKEELALASYKVIAGMPGMQDGSSAMKEASANLD